MTGVILINGMKPEQRLVNKAGEVFLEGHTWTAPELVDHINKRVWIGINSVEGELVAEVRDLAGKHICEARILSTERWSKSAAQSEADFSTAWVFLAHPDHERFPFRPNVLIEQDKRTRRVLSFNVYVGMPILVEQEKLAQFPGIVERLMRRIHNEHDRQFAEGSVYFDPGMAFEARREMVIAFKDGTRALPSIADYKTSLACWIMGYNATPQDVLGGKSPDEAGHQLTVEGAL